MGDGGGGYGRSGKAGVSGKWRFAYKRHFSIGTSEKFAKNKKATFKKYLDKLKL